MMSNVENDNNTPSKNVSLSEPNAGRFAPGNPGGPGRKSGSRNKTTLILDAMGDKAAKAILRKAIEQATGGDMRAIDLILARAWPPRKGRPVSIEMPAIATTSDIMPALQAILEAAASGALTPEEAAMFAGLIDAKRKAIETLEIEERLAKLEAVVHPRAGGNQ